MLRVRGAWCAFLPSLLVMGCLSQTPEGLAPATPAATTVKMDFEARPLPEIPLPNDIATRFDAKSPTLRRINASMVAPTAIERFVRAKIDQLDGWGTNQPITVPFTGPIDVQTILDRHRDTDYDLTDDAIYLIDIDPDSPEFGQKRHLDLGNGNYPFILEDMDAYGPHDPRGQTISLLFEEEDEDLNGNNILDPGEDTDYDGVLDTPNYLPGANPARDDLGARADALMTFYEKETNTLIARPMMPLRERTTYAVVITNRIKDTAGKPIGSPFPFINHTTQNEALARLPETLAPELTLDEVAFTWSFTTQTIEAGWVAVREGLYGHGVQGHLGRDFPDEWTLEPIRNVEYFTGNTNPHVLYTENWLSVFRNFGPQLFSFDEDDDLFVRLADSQQYIDYHVMGSYRSPQLFQRSYSAHPAPDCDTLCTHLGTCATQKGRPEFAAQCATRCTEWNDAQRACRADRCQAFEICEDDDPWLPYDAQSWPEDLDQDAAEARSEDVLFWLALPRREISPRKDGKPAPVVIVSHGYTLNRVDTMIPFAGELARRGNAVIGIDCPSHGPKPLEPDVMELVSNLLEGFGLRPLIGTLLATRAADQNRDGSIDSGADFWTSYLFHTRDVVRQCTLDHMQLIRILRSFDGVRKGPDLNGDGIAELAGDFDGDGVVDVGGPDGYIGMVGTSLGGIMSSMVAGTEPGLTASVPVAGGGILTDIGVRSFQGGVKEAVVLRLMSSVYLGAIEGERLKIQALLPDLNGEQTLDLGEVEGVAPGHTILATNLDNDERACALVNGEGGFRLHLATDLDDRVRLDFYVAPQPCLCDTDCTPTETPTPYGTFDSFGTAVSFQGIDYAKDSPLRALAEGLGLGRATPGLRRFMGIGQLVLDPADPNSLAPHYTTEPLKYPRVGDETSTHTLVVTSMGDMNVPASSGVSISRAAGYVDFLEVDPIYADTPFADVPPNQILLDTYTAEAVHTTDRFRDVDGNPVHYDVENFSAGEDIYKDAEIPRLNPPLRAGLRQEDPTGGVSGAIFLFVHPMGWHGFALPGTERAQALKACENACGEDDSACRNGCPEQVAPIFDGGDFMSGMLANYFASGGTRFMTDACLGFDNCPGDKPPFPPARADPEANPAP